MSAIGAFYLIRDNQRTEVVQAAEAQMAALNKKRFGFLPPKLPLNPDPFWDFIWANTRALETYPYSGFLLVDLERLAPGLLASRDEVGVVLSKITGSTFVSFRSADASATSALLDAGDFSDEAIKTLLSEEGRLDEFPDLAVPIRNSAAHVKRWLDEVSVGHTGILSIG